VEVHEDGEEEGTDLDEPQASVAVSVPFISPFVTDSQVLSTSPTQDTFQEKALPHIPPSNSDPVSGPEQKSLPPIVITTAVSSHQSSSPLSARSVSNPSFSLTKQHSLSNKTSLPALSPTRTSSSDFSVATPAIEAGYEEVAVVARPSSLKSRGSSKHGVKEEPCIVESDPVLFSAVDEADSVDQMAPSDFSGFEAYVEKRQKMERRRSTGVVEKRTSVASNRLSGDFGLKVTSGLTASTSAPGTLGGLPPKKFASLRHTMSKLGPNVRSATQLRPPPLPTTGSGLIRRPTVAAMLPSRATMLNEMTGIEDEESRRLCEMAFF